MNEFLTELPMSDDTASLIRKNEIVAGDALRLIAKRHRKLDPEKGFEAVANTIGILAAELVRDAHSILGDDLALAMRDLVMHHMDRSVELLSLKEGE